MSAVDFEYNGFKKSGSGYQGASFARISAGQQTREDVSRSAIWARKTAPLGFATIMLGALLHRFGFIPVDEMLSVLGAGALLALAAVGMSLNSFIDIWQLGVRGFFRAAVALVISLITLAPFALVVIGLLYLPKVSGVTTNAEDPPLMLADIAFGRVDQQVLTDQQSAYPAIQTQEFPLPAPQVYDLARGAAERTGLDITFELPPIVAANFIEVEGESVASTPAPRAKPIVLRDGSVMRRTVAKFYTEASAEGVFEASGKTPVLGFVDDVVVRVRAINNGSTVDVRSASRIGDHDLGANARRVQAFLRELDLTVKALSVN
ncbi:MAG: DUF1499 domain-containing protein [Alphaproteobacteria bacterium]|nr:DUF1499 domain-containing protein [Alphaproteobacteria bacterium]